MEAYELISTGAWSIVPPLLALGLALITKEVYSSLTIGVFVGMLIYQFSLNGAGGEQIVDSFVMLPQMMAEQMAGNAALLLFLALLGALTVVITVSGGSRAYAEWVSQHVKSPRAAQLLTAILGIIIFVDDYFNCLTVGAVMRPITDRFHISHEKLAWIIDSTAAPVCIIAPVSSWAVAVGGYMGDDGFNTFVASIPYNFYALLTIFFVFFMLATQMDFGTMLAAENAARDNKVPAEDAVEEKKVEAEIAKISTAVEGGPHSTIVAEQEEPDFAALVPMEEYKGLRISQKGKVFDLVGPILILICFAILGMMYVGGFFTDGVDFATAVGEDPVMGLNVGVCVALLCTVIMFLPRKLMSLDTYVSAVSEGIRSMVGAIMILVLAWSLGGVCRYLLGTGEFVSGFLNSIGSGLEILPAIIFVVAAFVAFAMGTSWGTVALIIPIVMGVFPADETLFLVAIGATLAGAVYGDHVSPISDTTILSSAGANCNHLRHVATQLPYASMVMVICLIGYLIAGFTQTPWISLGLGVVLIVVCAFVLHRISVSKAEKAQ